MSAIGQVGTGGQPPFEAIAAHAAKSVAGPATGEAHEETTVEEPEGAETTATQAEGGDAPVDPGDAEYDSDTIATLRQFNVPKSAIERLTPAEADRMAFKFLRAEARRRGGQEGQTGSSDRPSTDPAAPRESTAERATGLSDAALSEALSGLMSLEKDQGIEGLSAAFGKPLGLLSQHVTSQSKEFEAFKKAHETQGQILQTLLTDRAVERQRAKYPQLSEGSVRDRFIKQLHKQLKAEDGSALEGLDAAADRAALIELGSGTAAKPKSNGSANRLRAQPSASGTKQDQPRDPMGQFMPSDDRIRAILRKHGA